MRRLIIVFVCFCITLISTVRKKCFISAFVQFFFTCAFLFVFKYVLFIFGFCVVSYEGLTSGPVTSSCKSQVGSLFV